MEKSRTIKALKSKNIISKTNSAKNRIQLLKQQRIKHAAETEVTKKAKPQTYLDSYN